MTDGIVRGTSSLTRKVVRNIDLSGQRCLDVGAQEGLLTVLMARRGAQRVAAYDRLDLSDRLDLVKEAYGVDFDYYHSLQISELPARLTQERVPPFDVVVFAGVLYHMIDPLSGLATVRSCLRNGGIMLIETAVHLSEDHVALFNAGGRLYPGSNYFLISLATYDYFARMLRMKPIDMLFTRPSENGISRVCLVCRAVDSVVAEPGDEWMQSDWVEKDMAAAGLRYAALGSDRPDVPYTQVNPDLVYRPGTDCIDVLATFKASRPNAGLKEEGQLFLSDSE
jgi:SAM-dependent methyltransferase